MHANISTVQPLTIWIVVTKIAVIDNILKRMWLKHFVTADPEGTALPNHPITIERHVLTFREEAQMSSKILGAKMIVWVEGWKTDPLVDHQLGDMFWLRLRDNYRHNIPHHQNRWFLNPSRQLPSHRADQHL